MYAIVLYSCISVERMLCILWAFSGCRASREPRLRAQYSFKTIVECTFSKKNVSHWKSEYEIDYWVNSVCNGKIVNENSIWVVEACSSDEARSIATKHFANVSGFNIRNIKKVWSY